MGTSTTGSKSDSARAKDGFVRSFFVGFNGPEKDLSPVQVLCANVAEGIGRSIASYSRSVGGAIQPVVVEHAARSDRRMHAYDRRKSKGKLLGLLYMIVLLAVGL
jgi:hypothetical protein